MTQPQHHLHPALDDNDSTPLPQSHSHSRRPADQGSSRSPFPPGPNPLRPHLDLPPIQVKTGGSSSTPTIARPSSSPLPLPQSQPQQQLNQHRHQISSDPPTADTSSTEDLPHHHHHHHHHHYFQHLQSLPVPTSLPAPASHPHHHHHYLPHPHHHHHLVQHHHQHPPSQQQQQQYLSGSPPGSASGSASPNLFQPSSSANLSFSLPLPLAHSASSSSSTSTSFISDRALRSPHPTLTSSLFAPVQSHWPGRQALPHSHVHPHSQVQVLSPSYEAQAEFKLPNRPYYSSPLNELPPPLFPPPLSTTRRQHSFSNGETSSAAQPPPCLPPISHTSSTSIDQSPVLVPPPLRFNFSASPPAPQSKPHSLHQDPQTAQLNCNDLEMPPRKKVAPLGSSTRGGGPGGADSMGITPATTPMTVSSSSAASRTRNGAKGKGWTMEHTFDSVGQKKEVIVIDDSSTPDHPPRKRTRAMAQAEALAAQQASLGHSQQSTAHSYGHGSSSVAGSAVANGNSRMGNHVNGSASTVGSAKKRKVDEGSELSSSTTKKKGKASGAAAANYSASTQAAKPLPPPTAAPLPSVNTWDDAEGHFIVKPDDVIGGRYKIVRLLGQGTFGKVVEARHIESRRKVAIKVIRAVQKYRDASKIEIRVLETLKKHDPPNDNKCIHLEEYFDYRNHPCIVSELYGMSVFDFLKQNSFQPFPEKHIQDFAKSLLRSVEFLHKLKLVHTDLKPENILLVSNEARLQGPRRAGAKSKSILRNSDIRLIDFGSATFENEYHSSVVSTRHYRAPEIILGLPWSYPCDMFSIGCILVEFYTGDALFQTHDNLEHLGMMEVVMGRMPERLVQKGKLKKPEFFRGNKVDFPNSGVSRSSRKYVKSLRSLAQIITPTSTHNKLFLDLVVRLLEFDPDVRMNVGQAMRHPYLTTPIPDPE